MPAVRQRLALPSVMLLMVVVHRDEHLLLHLHLLDDGYRYVLHHGHRHVLVNRHLLNHGHLLDDRHMHWYMHFRHVVMVDRVDFVRHVDRNVLVAVEQNLFNYKNVNLPIPLERNNKIIFLYMFWDSLNSQLIKSIISLNVLVFVHGIYVM